MYGLAGIKKMNYSYFKLGDRVIHAGRHHGKIIKLDYPVKDDGNKPGALMEFDDKGVIPPQMGVSYNSIIKAFPTGGPGTRSGTKVMTGAKAVLKIDGVEVAFAPVDGYSCSAKLITNTDTNCPSCGDVWKETPHIVGDMWYDCIKCNKTKETIMKEEGYEI